MKKIVFILNGRLKNTARTKIAIHKMFGWEYSVSVAVTNGSEDAINISKQAVIDGTDYLIAAGGDGTMSEVVNGIMLIEKEKRENLIVGLYPLGGGNDFARTMKLSKKLEDLYQLVKQNSISKIDIGKLEYKKINGEDGIRYFNNITDIGIGAEVAKRVNEGKKMYGANFDFFKATLISFLKYERKKIRIEADGLKWSGNLLILCISNGKYFGSGLGISPQAKVDDGKFSVTLAGEVSLWDYLKNVFKIRRCKMLNHPGIIYSDISECRIEPDGEPCLIEADGEMIGTIPLKATLLKSELNLLANKKIL
jgi:diacylglycerol kinase (ATP)